MSDFAWGWFGGAATFAAGVVAYRVLVAVL